MTMTLDPDVAIRLRDVREEQKMSLRDMANAALRQELNWLEKQEAKPRRRCSTPVFNGGKLLIDPKIACTSELLAIGEGEAFK